jgi:hypothetical protein
MGILHMSTIRFRLFILALAILPLTRGVAQLVPPVPPEKRGRSDAERSGFHDANNIRTVFWNYGMVGDYPQDPIGVDLSVFHSVEVPKGTGMNYSDGITPFVLAKIVQTTGDTAYIMETGYRERQGQSPHYNRVMRFEPRPGYFEADPAINKGRSPAISNDPRTWPATWPDKDASWNGYWNGYFGKQPAADQESYTVMDDDFYDAWNYNPDNRDTTRRGLGLRVDVRGFQWGNPQAGNVIFWHYDITNEGTTDYPMPGQPENIIFGLYMDSGVGGSTISCDGIAESDDDNAFFDRSSGLNLVYTWDTYGHGRDLRGSCSPTGYLGYAYLETPGKPFDGIDNDQDGITDETRDSGPGQLIVGQSAIINYVLNVAHYDTANFHAFYGMPITQRPAYLAGRWWTGDEDLDWVAAFDDVGEDGVAGTNDPGEGDGIPTEGEPHFDRTDKDESDQIGLTGFKMNRINGPINERDDILFFTNEKHWPERLYRMWTNPDISARFDTVPVNNINIGFLFASGPFTLKAGKTERFSLALAYGEDLQQLRNTVKVVQAIYNSNYQFAVPPPPPTVQAETGDHYVQLAWDDISEHSTDPVAGTNDFEGYRIYRSTDPDFRDPRIIVSGRGENFPNNGKPIGQFDLKDGISGYSRVTVEGVAYYLGSESGITHTWRDTSVTNGQQYYYAVCAYDYGPSITFQNNEVFTYYPSENAITVSRTPRGGTILPKNVVAVRANAKTLGYTPAEASLVTKASGDGFGVVNIRILDSKLVPNNHIFKITFNAFPEFVHPLTYNLYDSTAGKYIFKTGEDFEGLGTGISGVGLQPIVTTPKTIVIDSINSGFTPNSQTNAKFAIDYSATIPINNVREGFPDNLTITFSNTVVDTVFGLFGDPAPARFRVTAHSPAGDRHLKSFFVDLNGDSTLSPNPGSAEEIQVLTGADSIPYNERFTWRIRLKENRDTIRTPTQRDVYELRLLRPFSAGDVFTFNTKAEFIADAKAKQEFQQAPYVVPNPYVGAVSFEPQPFATTGHERRIEFRGLPQNCTIRIYTVHGELVETLRHDGSMDGYVPWNLRTKDNLDVAPGLYIYHVDAGPFGSHIGKFAIIK